MDEDFIFQVTEEELTQFPEEEENQTEEEQSIQALKPGKEIPQEIIEGQNKGNSKVNIPSLLDLKLPKLYAASRNGRWNKGPSVPKSRRKCRGWRRRQQCSPQTQKCSYLME